MHAGNAVLDAVNVQAVLGQLDLLPLQVADLRGPQAVAVGDQDHCRVAMAVATILASAVHQPLDLALGEIASLDCRVHRDRQRAAARAGVRRRRQPRGGGGGDPQGGGRAKIENSSRRHPRKFGQKRFLVLREVLARKWGGLFWGYLLRKNFRRRDRDRLVPPSWMDAAVYRAEVCYPFGGKHGRHWTMKRRARAPRKTDGYTTLLLTSADEALHLVRQYCRLVEIDLVW